EGLARAASGRAKQRGRTCGCVLSASRYVVIATASLLHDFETHRHSTVPVKSRGASAAANDVARRDRRACGEARHPATPDIVVAIALRCDALHRAARGGPSVEYNVL